MKKKTIFIFILILMTVLVGTTYASTEVNLKDKWYDKSIKYALDNKILQGNNGEILPENNITRAEVATIVDRILKLETKANLDSYKDINLNDWYYVSMQKNVAANLLKGTKTLELKGNDDITREEAFVIISRILLLDKEQNITNNFKDKEDISVWALDSISILENKGYIKGHNNMLRPKDKITRAEFAQVIYNIIEEYPKNKEVEVNTVKDTVINNEIVKNIKGKTRDIILAEGTGNSEITLENLDIDGDIIIRGGKRLILKDVGKINQVRISDSMGKFEIELKGNSEILKIIDPDKKITLIKDKKIEKNDAIKSKSPVYSSGSNTDNNTSNTDDNEVKEPTSIDILNLALKNIEKSYEVNHLYEKDLNASMIKDQVKEQLKNKTNINKNFDKIDVSVEPTQDSKIYQIILSYKEESLKSTINVEAILDGSMDYFLIKDAVDKDKLIIMSKEDYEKEFSNTNGEVYKYFIKGRYLEVEYLVEIDENYQGDFEKYRYVFINDFLKEKTSNSESNKDIMDRVKKTDYNELKDKIYELTFNNGEAILTKFIVNSSDNNEAEQEEGLNELDSFNLVNEENINIANIEE